VLVSYHGTADQSRQGDAATTAWFPTRGQRGRRRTGRRSRVGCGARRDLSSTALQFSDRGDSARDTCGSELSADVDIKLPTRLVGGLGLPMEVLTEEPPLPSAMRRARSQALILANHRRDEDQSSQELTRIGAPDLLRRSLYGYKSPVEIWPSRRRAAVWHRLCAVGEPARCVVGPLCRVRAENARAHRREGLPFPMPLMQRCQSRWPKNSGEFSRIAPRVRGQAAKWRTQFATVHAKRACFLGKQAPSGTVLTGDELKTLRASQK